GTSPEYSRPRLFFLSSVMIEARPREARDRCHSTANRSTSCAQLHTPEPSGPLPGDYAHRVRPAPVSVRLSRVKVIASSALPRRTVTTPRTSASRDQKSTVTLTRANRGFRTVVGASHVAPFVIGS